MSPPMVSSQLVLSRLYTIHVVADDIHDLICKISFVSALRDLRRRRRLFIIPSTRLWCDRLYAIYIAAGAFVAQNESLMIFRGISRLAEIFRNTSISVYLRGSHIHTPDSHQVSLKRGHMHVTFEKTWSSTLE
jgi:hypothetical protein